MNNNLITILTSTAAAIITIFLFGLQGYIRLRVKRRMYLTKVLNQYFMMISEIANRFGKQRVDIIEKVAKETKETTGLSEHDLTDAINEYIQNKMKINEYKYNIDTTRILTYGFNIVLQSEAIVLKESNEHTYDIYKIKNFSMNKNKLILKEIEELNEIVNLIKKNRNTIEGENLEITLPLIAEQLKFIFLAMKKIENKKMDYLKTKKEFDEKFG